MNVTIKRQQKIMLLEELIKNNNMKTSFSQEEIGELIIEGQISRLVFDVAIFGTINFNLFVILSVTQKMTKELLLEIQYYCFCLKPIGHRTHLIYNALTRNG